MYFYIKEWPNKTATLMAENGTVMWTFHSAAEARNVVREWYKAQEDDINYELHYLDDPSCSCVSVA